jgi:hypothetical protein
MDAASDQLAPSKSSQLRDDLLSALQSVQAAAKSRVDARRADLADKLNAVKSELSRLAPKDQQSIESGLCSVPEVLDAASVKAAVTTDHPVTASVAKLLQGRCERAVKGFKS